MDACNKPYIKVRKALFSLGSVVATRGASSCLDVCGLGGLALLVRHQTGDWGQLCEEDRKSNDHALKSGLRLLSSYRMPHGQTIWLISEADRSVTTLMLPEEY